MEAAQAKVRDLETQSLFPVEETSGGAVTVEHAVEQFLKDAKARHVADSTYTKLRYTLQIAEPLCNYDAGCEGFFRLGTEVQIISNGR